MAEHNAQKSSIKDIEQQLDEIDMLDIDDMEEKKNETKKDTKLKKSVQHKKPDFDDDEDFEDDYHSSKKKSKKGFPFGGLILMFFLIAVILAAGYFGLQYMDVFSTLKDEYDGVLKAAEAERDAAAALYAEADPDSAANTAERQCVTEEMISLAEAEMESLREKDGQIDAALSEAEKTISELQGLEGYDYYRAIYDEYVEGRSYVESLLSGD